MIPFIVKTITPDNDDKAFALFIYIITDKNFFLKNYPPSWPSLIIKPRKNIYDDGLKYFSVFVFSPPLNPFRRFRRNSSNRIRRHVLQLAKNARVSRRQGRGTADIPWTLSLYGGGVTTTTRPPPYTDKMRR